MLRTAAAIQENAEDIYEDAKQLNEERAAEAEIYEDFCGETEGSDDKETAEA